MKVKKDFTKIKNLLEDERVDEIIIKEDLKRKLKQDKPLRVKFGVDPTFNTLHLGHTVPLFKLKQFQELGHQVIFLIGDFTSRVGDPSGRVKSRPILTKEEIEENMRSYKKQAAKILDINKVEVRYNSEWWEDMNLSNFLNLLRKVTYNQVIKRADFQERIENDQSFTIQELIYPVIQGYDSVALKADVEIGGTDQKFNILMGRKIQKQYNQPEQNVILCPLLEGTDGSDKMSKSKDNFIGVTEKPKEMYGKIMSIPDKVMSRYYNLLTSLSKKEISNKMNEHPRKAKAFLAETITAFFYSSSKAKKAAKEFDKVFKKQKNPDDVPVKKIKAKEMGILDLLVKLNLTSSKSEARRLINQKGIRINGEVQNDKYKKVKIKKGMIIQRGKRKFVKIS